MKERKKSMSTAKNIDQLLQGFVDEGLPGCSLHIAQRGKTLYEGYFGYSDIENNEYVNKKSVFRMASMSKIPLYTVMMRLYEQGKFLLTDPIYHYLPEWKESKKVVQNPNGYLEIVPAKRPITISDTLSMKCGLPYCHAPSNTKNPTRKGMEKCLQPLWERGHYTLREQTAAVAHAPLAFEPGTHWLYGFSSELAAGIIEKVCDKPIDDVFDELLFQPLDMENTRSHYFGDMQKRMVKLYQKTKQGELVRMDSPMDDKHIPGPEHEAGWARLFSNGEDYTRLMQMLANGGFYNGRQIMGRKTIDMMRANGLNETQLKDYEDNYSAGYGYGYGVRTLINQQKGNHNGSIGAFGWTGGFGTWCEADPTDGISIVYMHNMMPNQEEYYHLRVRNIAYGFID